MNFAGLFGEGQGVMGKWIEGTIGHGALLGALTGAGQWLVLRSKIQHAPFLDSELAP